MYPRSRLEEAVEGWDGVGNVQVVTHFFKYYSIPRVLAIQKMATATGYN
jgi:hypothetical protein